MLRERIVTLVLDITQRSESNHPFHLLISRKGVEELGIEIVVCAPEDYQFTGVLYTNDQEDCTKKLERGLFVTVKVEKNIEHLYDGSERNPVILFATKAFFKHYNLRPGGIQFKFSAIGPVPLDRVVFGARTQEAFTWAKSENWNTNLLIALVQGNTLCRNGDVPLFNYNPSESPNLIFDLITLECSPVCQGIMNSNTSVLVVRLSTQMLDQRTENEKSIETLRNNNSVDSYLNLMNFTSRLLMLNQVPFNSGEKYNRNVIPVIKTLATSNAALKVLRNSKPFQIEIMPKQPRGLESIAEETDLHNSIFINPSDMSNFLEINKNHNWIYVKLKWADNDEIDDVDQVHNSWRLVRLHLSPQIFPSCTAQLSPQLWFNINKHPSPLLQPNCNLIIKPATMENIPPYAEEVYFALIASPNYSTIHNFDFLIKSYFNTTRCVKVGDIIALSVKGKEHEIPMDRFNSDFTFSPTIYITVSRIELPQNMETNKDLCYRADTNNSRLYHTGLKQNYVPVTMETFFSENPFHRIFDVPTPPGSIGRARDKLYSIISPFLKSRKLRERVSTNILLSGPIGCGKRLAIKAVCRSLNLHLCSVDCQELIGDAAGATETRLRNSATKAIKFAPVVLHLNNIGLLSRERKETASSAGEDPRTIGNFAEVLDTLSNQCNWPLIVIATTESSVGAAKSGHGESLHPDLASLFIHHIYLGTPNEKDRALILEGLLPLDMPDSISVTRLAQKTAGFAFSDLQELVTTATWKAFQRVEEHLSKNNLDIQESELALAGIPLRQKDLDSALEKLQSSQAQSIGAPKIPNVRWDDVGGLEDVKKEILNTIQLPLNHPELIQTGLRRSGVLLYGPPGTGKTLLAKAVATECSLNFLSVKGPELINMYVGQSEENVREVFHRARGASPCVIFFDELDSLAPNRGLSGDSGGVMDRVVSQLLAELDGINQTTANIFVIGATNRPDLIDPALLRPGRFDRLVELGVAKTSKERLNILSALTRKMPLSNDVNLEELERASPSGLTGADFYSLCSEAQTKALERCVRDLEDGKFEEENVKPKILMEDFTFSLKSLVPSVFSKESSNIHSSLTRKMSLSNDVKSEELERASSSGLTGSDCNSSCADAQTKALERCEGDLEDSQIEEENVKPKTKMEDFEPSVSK